jgi:hypothetical protein
MMEPLVEALCLMQRNAELELQCMRTGVVELDQEREFFHIRHRLEAYPGATRAILTTCERLHRSPDAVSLRDVTNCIEAQRVD